ncbi:MAG: hypothetical protein LBR35_00095 [Rickettsiales bacterium]|jgi:hypothetical protein|nr:hypothetical protein [Rickettsiales bacterium]
MINSEDAFKNWPTKNIVLFGNDIKTRDIIINNIKTIHQASVITDLTFLKNPNQNDEVLIILDIDEKLKNADHKTVLNFFEFLDLSVSHVLLTTSTLPKLMDVQEDILSRLNSYFMIKI